MPYRWIPEAFVEIAKHGVEPHEVIQALRNRERAVAGVHPSGIVILAVTGTTKAGRRLTVYLRPEGGFDSAIIGAREAE